MNLSQLEAFIETCQQGSYTRAAERLFISQPALHHKVKQLETALGTPLLVVRNRHVIPTAEGQLVLDVARRVLQEVHSLEEHFRLMKENQAVRVGATSLLGAMVLSSAVAQFRAERPQISVHVISLDPDELYAAFVGNKVDLAVAWQNYVTPDLQTEPLRESATACFAAVGHPLADGEVHEPDELLQYPIALTEKGMGLRTTVEQWFFDVLGLRDLPVAFEARTGALLAQVAASSPDYITFLPEDAARQFNLAPILLAAPTWRSTAVICYLPGQYHRPAAKQFLHHLRRIATEQQAALGPTHSHRPEGRQPGGTSPLLDKDIPLGQTGDLRR
jgi:DNA-binding transcriptional LysR family regulator